MEPDPESRILVLANNNLKRRFAVFVLHWNSRQIKALRNRPFLLLGYIAQPDNFDYNLKMAYSLDFRRKVLSVREKKGLTIAEVAARFDVGVASVTRWVKNIHRKPQGFRQRKIDLDVLRQDIRDYPDAYQYERAKRLGVAQNAIFLALKKLGVTYKKNSEASQSRHKRTAYLPGEDRCLWSLRPGHCLYWWKWVCTGCAAHARLCTRWPEMSWHAWLACARSYQRNWSVDRKAIDNRQPVCSQYQRRCISWMGDAGPVA